jgi:SOS response regulatory protein OraA/RecX
VGGQRVDAVGVAARALTSRDLSVAALIERMRRAGAEGSDIEEVVARLKSSGYLDDGRVALERARRLAERGYGDAAIDARLELEGFEQEGRAGALAELEPEAARAVRVAARCDGRRLAATLSRRGFGEDVIEAIIARLDGQAGAKLR